MVCIRLVWILLARRPRPVHSANQCRDTLDELQKDLDIWLSQYNEERVHSGKCFFGKTPMQTFRDSIPLMKEKMLNQNLQTKKAGLSG